jgi:hypothetical protein
VRHLTCNIMHDGSRCFVTLRPTAGWIAVREHVAQLKDAEVTSFVTDGVTEAWMDFRYAGYEFNVNDAPGDYWFFVNDPACPEPLLQLVADHFERLLEPTGSRPGSRADPSLEQTRES